jgi:hypothetical protein
MTGFGDDRFRGDTEIAGEGARATQKSKASDRSVRPTRTVRGQECPRYTASTFWFEDRFDLAKVIEVVSRNQAHNTGYALFASL